MQAKFRNWKLLSEKKVRSLVLIHLEIQLISKPINWGKPMAIDGCNWRIKEGKAEDCQYINWRIQSEKKIYKIYWSSESNVRVWWVPIVVKTRDGLQNGYKKQTRFPFFFTDHTFCTYFSVKTKNNSLFFTLGFVKFDLLPHFLFRKLTFECFKS